jgi:Fe-S-cluster containining protein
MPGALVPRDLPIIAAHLGYDDVRRFADECLLASEGAKVRIEGRVISLPTLVPANGADGFCRFLKGGRCTIHAVSPFGCAYFDHHLSHIEFDRRANTLCAELLADLQRQGEYSRLCEELRARGREAPSLESRRDRVQEAARKERR